MENIELFLSKAAYDGLNFSNIGVAENEN